MPVRIGEAVWEGTLEEGKGTIRVKSGIFESPYNAEMRFGQEPGTNPEELIGAALAGCFSMFLALMLSKVGYVAEKIYTRARVHLDKVEEGFKLSHIDLITECKVPGISSDLFLEQAKVSKENCPVSRALAVPINLEAGLSVRDSK